MIYYQSGSENTIISRKDLENGLKTALDKLGKRHKVLVVPPDFTRHHSRPAILQLLYIITTGRI
jgi:nickel-dependent lactate racemase